MIMIERAFASLRIANASRVGREEYFKGLAIVWIDVAVSKVGVTNDILINVLEGALFLQEESLAALCPACRTFRPDAVTEDSCKFNL